MGVTLTRTTPTRQIHSIANGISIQGTHRETTMEGDQNIVFEGLYYIVYIW
jgi:hypothetical protein